MILRSVAMIITVGVNTFDLLSSHLQNCYHGQSYELGKSVRILKQKYFQDLQLRFDMCSECTTYSAAHICNTEVQKART